MPSPFAFLNDEHEAAHYNCLRDIEELDFQQIAIDALQDEGFADGAWAFVSENDLNDVIDTHIRRLQDEFIAPGGPAHQSWTRVRNATNPEHLQGIEDNNLDLDTFEEIYATIQERLREEVINELTQEFWRGIEKKLDDLRPVALAYDGCHKIYCLVDDRVLEHDTWQDWRRASEDDTSSVSFLFVDDLSAKEQMEILQGWYYSSCHLAFVYAISSNSPDHSDNPAADRPTLRWGPDLQYTTLIEQTP